MISVFKRTINNQILQWRVKLSGFSSYESYIKYTDPDINLLANTVNKFYHGYPYIAIPTQPFPYANIIEWCTNNSKSKWRNDWHRVSCEFTGTFNDDRIYNITLQFNELGGADVMFFAFKSLKDYNWFLLRWETHVYKY